MQKMMRQMGKGKMPGAPPELTGGAAAQDGMMRTARKPPAAYGTFTFNERERLGTWQYA